MRCATTVAPPRPRFRLCTASPPWFRLDASLRSPPTRASLRSPPIATAKLTDVTYDDSGTASNFARDDRKPPAHGRAGNLGQGVGVAVIDTGVSPMTDFDNRLVHGPDLSGEGTTIDSFGHGTVMAGIIAGSGADSANRSKGAYTGVAPGAHIVAVKTAGANGVVDVSTMLQAMGWVAAYKDQFNIRVLNLSWGVPSTQDPAVDPLNYAVERLWSQWHRRRRCGREHRFVGEHDHEAGGRPRRHDRRRVQREQRHVVAQNDSIPGVVVARSDCSRRRQARPRRCPAAHLSRRVPTDLMSRQNNPHALVVSELHQRLRDVGGRGSDFRGRRAVARRRDPS